ncbi:MAG: O-antigen ligase family protein [Flavobacterium sp.]|nr:O-antigen ligase family protein [Flavobacterium sp.]
MVYVSVLFAILRTEMVYLLLGALLAILISIKQFKSVGRLKGVALVFVCVAMVLYLLPTLLDTIIETTKLALKGGALENDESADHRINVQLPVLMKIIESSPFFGGGLYSVSYGATTHYLLYDIPVLGAFGAYGIIGMLIYYSRFIYIFSRYKVLEMSQILFDQFPIECLLVNGLLAYFISMITFRTLHINIELAFDFGMPEFGLFIGVYFGLIKILSEKRLDS